MMLDGMRRSREQFEEDQAYAVAALRRMGVPWSMLEEHTGQSKSTLIRQQSRTTEAEPRASAD
jgi:hypothetical protein